MKTLRLMYNLSGKRFISKLKAFSQALNDFILQELNDFINKVERINAEYSNDTESEEV